MKTPDSAGRTDPGRVRKRNEDAILLRDDVGLWVVADGMGGHAAGDFASAMIVQRLAEVPRGPDLVSFVEAIENCLLQVNRDLRSAAREREAEIVGSTVVMLVQGEDFMLCGWVGDSRCYCLENGALRQVSRDHTEAVPVSEPGAPPSRPPALTRAVGAEDELFIDWLVASNAPGIAYLLCSDGLIREVSDAEIESGLGRGEPLDESLAGLFAMALDRGARDNVSAVALRVRG